MSQRKQNNKYKVIHEGKVKSTGNQRKWKTEINKHKVNPTANLNMKMTTEKGNEVTVNLHKTLKIYNNSA